MKSYCIVLWILIFSSVSCKSTQSYSLGEEFKISLEGEGDGGFGWNMEKIPEIQIVDSTNLGKEKENGLYQYSKVYTLKGLSRGTYSLRFNKIRSFQPNLILDENRKQIEIKIKK
ncbi:protease inhibitor I42 family protein [Flagellimonas myxillae]|uniref:protease inhibitor I42 family protein n=1 Tax=Flagellimonas myxillae TaxID=2942214 RepID=UPI00201ECCD9|nr:protease inhibitor I42 family protein [Muricauda myxillae]MCL6265064.1 protease inhibitor I42 family protein [Muricauda myxillae]